jgi:bifunctional non-homologous end joining protein LigD
MILSSAKEPPPRDDEWAFEIKWDGMRALIAVAADGAYRVFSRHGVDHTASFPELGALASALPGRPALIDGELVCQDATGRPSFARIRQRWIPSSPVTAAALARSTPATFVAFDLLEIDGTNIMSCCYDERRERLAELELHGPNWFVTDYQVGNGAAVIAESRRQGLEGVVAKRRRSRYRPGLRSPDWRKLKNYQRGSFVIGAWLPRPGGSIEALYVGSPTVSGQLRFEGTVEFGLERQRQQLRDLLEVIATDDAPFAWNVSRRVRWVRPLLVAEVNFLGRDAGVLREAILHGVALAK